MACVCGSSRALLSVSGCAGDSCYVYYRDFESEGVPYGLNIDGLNLGLGDCLQFKMCMDCGRVQGKVPFPISEDEIKKAFLGK